MSTAVPFHASHEMGALGRIPRRTGQGLQLRCRSPAESSRRAPCIHARLRRLATKPGEKCGLIAFLIPRASTGFSGGRNRTGQESFRSSFKPGLAPDYSWRFCCGGMLIAVRFLPAITRFHIADSVQLGVRGSRFVGRRVQYQKEAGFGEESFSRG